MSHQNTRRRLLRKGAAGVALGLAVVVGARLLTPDPAPPLLRDLPGSATERDQAFDQRVARVFPKGSDEAQLRQRLAGEGFKVDPARRTAEWQHVGFPCKDFAQVQWQAANGRVATTRAVVWQACT